MRWLIFTLALLLTFPVKADPRLFSTAELESLLAPVALQPDAVLWNVLDASTTPQEVIDAAASDAEDGPWSPAVRALLPYPDLLDRMAESPQWLFDLGNAYVGQRNEVLAAVQTLRQRAYGSGYLQSDPVQVVQHYGNAIAVVPAVPSYFVVRYYNPLIVFGGWRPVRHVHWTPWVHRPVPPKHVYHHPAPPKHVHRPAPPKQVQRPAPPRHVQAPPRNGPPSVAARMQQQQAAQFQRYHRIPEAQRKPIVQQHYRNHAPARPQVQHRGNRF